MTKVLSMFIPRIKVIPDAHFASQLNIDIIIFLYVLVLSLTCFAVMNCLYAS